MPAYQAGSARVSSTVTKRNPRPRKYASASERQAAYRARAPEVCFRAEAKTVETLDSIAETLDQPRADLLLSMTKFALANHDWARFGLTHKPLPYGYGLAEQEFVGPRMSNPKKPIWERTRPKSLGKPVPLTPKQKTAAKKRAAAAGRPYPNLVDNIATARLENPTVKKPTPAQLAARARFAEMARSGAFKRKAKRKTNPVEGEKFQVGKYYETRSIGDADMKIGATILARTDKSVKVKGNNNLMKTSYRLTKDYNGNEVFYPWGRYSMAPQIGADDEKPKANPAKKTVSQKISQLVREGYPQKQAIAIALNEERAGKVKATPRKRNPITETLIYGLAPGETRDYMEELLYAGGLKLTPEQIQKVLAAATAAGYHSFRVTGFDPTVGAAFVRTMGQTRQRKRNPATGRKESRTKLNPSSRTVYVIHEADKPMNVLGVFSDEKKAIKLAQQTADFRGLKLVVSKHEVRG